MSVVFGHGELVQQVAGDLARTGVGGLRRTGHVELVDGRVPVAIPPGTLLVVGQHVGIHPGVGRHVEVLVAGVDGRPLGQHGGRGGSG